MEFEKMDERIKKKMVKDAVALNDWFDTEEGIDARIGIAVANRQEDPESTPATGKPTDYLTDLEQAQYEQLKKFAQKAAQTSANRGYRSPAVLAEMAERKAKRLDEVSKFAQSLRESHLEHPKFMERMTAKFGVGEKQIRNLLNEADRLKNGN